MNRDQIKQIVEETVEKLLEGGPGSGRYPRGSGKDPDADEEGGGGGKKEKTTYDADPKENDRLEKKAAQVRKDFPVPAGKHPADERINSLLKKNDTSYPLVRPEDRAELAGHVTWKKTKDPKMAVKAFKAEYAKSYEASSGLKFDKEHEKNSEDFKLNLNSYKRSVGLKAKKIGPEW